MICRRAAVPLVLSSSTHGCPVASSTPFLTTTPPRGSKLTSNPSGFFSCGNLVGPVTKTSELFGQLRLFLLHPGELRASRIECRFGDPPFGAHRCLPREQVGKRGLRLTRSCLRLGQFAGEPGGMRLGILQPLLDLAPLRIQSGDRPRRVTLQRFLAGDVRRKGRIEALQLGEAA